jgi:hypothetical protein
MLSERPGIELRACGEAGREDFLALQQRGEDKPAPAAGEQVPAASLTPEQRQQLLALAQLRSEALKRWLVNEKGIAAERIYPCKPAADPEGEVSGIRLDL